MSFVPDLRTYLTLHYAVQQGSFEAVSLLLAKGAKPGCMDNTHKTPLHFAASKTELFPILQLLINHDVKNINTVDAAHMTPIQYAANYCSVSVIEYMLQHGGDINYPSESSSCTALHYAAENSAEMIKFLLEKGAKSTRDRAGYYPIHYAAKTNTPAAIEAFLLAGEQLDNHSDKNGTPLYVAAEFNSRLDTIAYLIKHGANVNAVNLKSETPLLAAVKHNTIDVVMLLLQNGADINFRNFDKKTVFHLAVEKKDHKLLTVLLKHLLDNEISFGKFPPILKELNAYASSNPDLSETETSKLIRELLDCDHETLKKTLNQLATNVPVNGPNDTSSSSNCSPTASILSNIGFLKDSSNSSKEVEEPPKDPIVKNSNM